MIMKEKEATKVIWYFGQMEGLKVKDQELKSLEPSTTFTDRQFEKQEEGIWRFWKNFI